MYYDPGRGAPYPEFYDRQQQAAAERRTLRQLGFYLGSAILLYILLQNLLTLPLALPGWYERYQNDGLLRNGVDLLVVMASMLLPFLGLSKPMRALSGCVDPVPLERPREGGAVVLFVFAGLMFCVAANELTDLLVTAVSAFGVELSTPEMPLPTGVFGVTSAVFRVIVMPALVEEICFRGVVMQHLRRFGNWFAILMSALCFGLLHCNLIQMPFACIVGLVLGYYVVRTGSLWPAILIHALNNTVSLVFSYLAATLEARQLNLVYLLVQFVLFALGTFCFLLDLSRSRQRARLPRSPKTCSTFGQKFAACFFAPPMLVAAGLVLYFTSRYVGLM